MVLQNVSSRFARRSYNRKMSLSKGATEILANISMPILSKKIDYSHYNQGKLANRNIGQHFYANLD